MAMVIEPVQHLYAKAAMNKTMNGLATWFDSDIMTYRYTQISTKYLCDINI